MLAPECGWARQRTRIVGRFGIECLTMTVAEIFKVVDLSPHGPVPWKTKISERNAGVYVIGLVGNADLGCEVCAAAPPTS